MNNIKEEGRCGSCGDHDIDYYNFDWDGDLMWHHFKCNSCGKYGKEYYIKQYDETIMDGDD